MIAPRQAAGARRWRSGRRPRLASRSVRPDLRSSGWPTARHKPGRATAVERPPCTRWFGGRPDDAGGDPSKRVRGKTTINPNRPYPLIHYPVLGSRFGLGFGLYFPVRVEFADEIHGAPRQTTPHRDTAPAVRVHDVDLRLPTRGSACPSCTTRVRPRGGRILLGSLEQLLAVVARALASALERTVGGGRPGRRARSGRERGLGNGLGSVQPL
eukprot:scaffold1959_cov403-Prasinococcus_capsulatus_cf.AAC.6